MSDIAIGLTALGLLVLGLGLFSSFIKNRTFIPEPLVALLLGFLLGPSAIDLLDPSEWGDQHAILREVARLTLAIGLMSVSLHLPRRQVATEARSLLVLLGVVMPCMWLIAGLSAWWLLDVPFWLAMLLGAIVTPTDPIVSTSIVMSERATQVLPERLRNLLLTETGLNDGLALPLVFLAMLMLTEPASQAFPHWLLHVIALEVGGSVILGILLGYAAGIALDFAESKKLTEKVSFLAYSLALSLLTLGVAEIVQVNGLLAVFVAGLAFSHPIGARDKAQEAEIQEAISQFFTLPIFALFGLILPIETWRDLGPATFLFAVLVLPLRRLPVILLLRKTMAPIRGIVWACFFGWFGPIGVASMFYGLLILDREGIEEPWAIGSLVIAISIFLHGFTATPALILLGKLKQDRADTANDTGSSGAAT